MVERYWQHTVESSSSGPAPEPDPEVCPKDYGTTLLRLALMPVAIREKELAGGQFLARTLTLDTGLRAIPVGLAQCRGHHCRVGTWCVHVDAIPFADLATDRIAALTHQKCARRGSR